MSIFPEAPCASEEIPINSSEASPTQGTEPVMKVPKPSQKIYDWLEDVPSSEESPDSWSATPTQPTEPVMPTPAPFQSQPYGPTIMVAYVIPPGKIGLVFTALQAQLQGSGHSMTQEQLTLVNVPQTHHQIMMAISDAEGKVRNEFVAITAGTIPGSFSTYATTGIINPLRGPMMDHVDTVAAVHGLQRLNVLPHQQPNAEACWNILRRAAENDHFPAFEEMFNTMLLVMTRFIQDQWAVQQGSGAPGVML